MINSKAIKVVKQLNKGEFQKLGKFLSSPYFNTNKNLVKTYNFVKRFYPEFTSEKFSKENLYKYVYENNRYNDEKLRKLLSDMYKELEKLLVILRLEADKKVYNKLLLRILDIKKLDGLFHLVFKDAENHLDEQDFEYDYFLEKFLLQWQYVSFHLDRGEQQKIALNVFKRGNYGTLFFLSDLFLTLNDINANRNTFGFNYEPNLSENFLVNFDVDSFFTYVDRGSIKHKEIVKIYYYAYLANKNFEEEYYFHDLETFVFDNWNKFSQLGKLTSIIYLMNYCSRKIFRGKDDFKSNLNKIYRRYLKYKLFIREEGGYVRSDIFLKIIDNFFHTGNIDEAESELLKNMEFLHPDHRNGILHYCRALVNFNNTNYDESLQELSLIKTNSSLFINRLKLLQLKTYYELSLFDDAFELANNYRKFICNYKTVSDMMRSCCMNFLGIYREMLKIKNTNSYKYSISELKNQMNQNNPVEKTWLKEKLNEIDNLL